MLIINNQTHLSVKTTQRCCSGNLGFCPTYLVLGVDLLVGEVGDRHLVVGRLSDLVLRPLAGLALVQEVSQTLVVNFNKACCEGELRSNRKTVPISTTRINKSPLVKNRFDRQQLLLLKISLIET